MTSVAKVISNKPIQIQESRNRRKKVCCEKKARGHFRSLHIRRRYHSGVTAMILICTPTKSRAGGLGGGGGGTSVLGPQQGSGQCPGNF